MLYAFLRERFADGGEDGFGFAITFGKALRVEFFFASIAAAEAAAGVALSAARWARPFSTAKCASWAVS